MAVRTIPEEVAVAIGQRVRNLREAHNMTRKDVADLIAMTPEGYAHIEYGKGASLATFRLLAMTFGCTYDDILGNPADGGEPDREEHWEAARRAGLSDAMHAIREIL